jgi:DnaJ-domain-containing protein 1
MQQYPGLDPAIVADRALSQYAAPRFAALRQIAQACKQEHICESA